jgi:hypothetical protein
MPAIQSQSADTNREEGLGTKVLAAAPVQRALATCIPTELLSITDYCTVSVTVPVAVVLPEVPVTVTV